jgi:hypothetical protein
LRGAVTHSDPGYDTKNYQGVVKMEVKIDDQGFEHANYDADGDVLYLTHGESNMAADAALMPEGHGVR